MGNKSVRQNTRLVVAVHLAILCLATAIVISAAFEAWRLSYLWSYFPTALMVLWAAPILLGTLMLVGWFHPGRQFRLASLFGLTTAVAGSIFVWIQFVQPQIPSAGFTHTGTTFGEPWDDRYIIIVDVTNSSDDADPMGRVSSMSLFVPPSLAVAPLAIMFAIWSAIALWRLARRPSPNKHVEEN